MKFLKFIIYLMALGTLLSVGAQVWQAISRSPYHNAKAANMNEVSMVNTPQPTNTPRPTNTLVPTATVDYQKTAEVAQSTADEARRINAQATAQHEELLMEAVRITEANNQREFIRESWTATVALTAIPLTATQQVIVNTQIPAEQKIAGGILTSTKEAPTQAAAMAKAANEKEFGAWIDKVQIMFMILLSVLTILIILRLGVKWYHEGQQRRNSEMADEAEPETHETVVQMRTDKGNGNFSQQRLVLPCSRNQFNQFAIGITQFGKSMAIGQWEKKDSGIGKPVIVNIRNWAAMERDEPFVNITKTNEYVPTDVFLKFLCGWLDTQTLPDGYEFEQGAVNEPPTAPRHATPEIMANFA